MNIINIRGIGGRKELSNEREEVLAALKARAFDGISHTYQPYSGYGKNSHQIEMSVSCRNIEVMKITTGKIFDGKEKARFEDRKTEVLSGYKAVDFIENRPYYYSLRRPDLF